MSYNGWRNYETWNVALWIGNDEPLYREAIAFMESLRFQTERRKTNPYRSFVTYMELTHASTPDKVKWISTFLDYDALNEMMRELTA